MTTEQFIQKQNKRLQQILKENKPLLFAVRSVMALQSQRIWLRGENAKGHKIGMYRKRTVYINPLNSPKKFIPKGKAGKKVFKNGNPHKTGYFPSWLAYKQKIGRNKINKTVDLFWKGELSRDWSNAPVELKGLPPKNPKAIKLNPNKYIVAISKLNYNKVSRYINVFGISKTEKTAFKKVLGAELKIALSN